MSLQQRYFNRATYFALRESNPDMSATLLWQFVNGDGSESLPEFVCARTRRHRWLCSGTAYGGDDPRWMGEGRMLCAYCGADGDA
jgi:hypothetical protein